MCNMPLKFDIIGWSLMQVRGDVFMARVFDNEDDFKRLDFSLQEVSSTAAWVKEAYAQNERKRKVISAVWQQYPIQAYPLTPRKCTGLEACNS